MTNFVHLTEGFTPRDLRRAATDIQSKFKTNKGESKYFMYVVEQPAKI